jgi:hypothetical protein
MKQKAQPLPAVNIAMTRAMKSRSRHVATEIMSHRVRAFGMVMEFSAEATMVLPVVFPR